MNITGMGIKNATITTQFPIPPLINIYEYSNELDINSILILQWRQRRSNALCSKPALTGVKAELKCGTL
jgi:hypothetical protein